MLPDLCIIQMDTLKDQILNFNTLITLETLIIASYNKEFIKLVKQER